jgi:hypothetical protein
MLQVALRAVLSTSESLWRTGFCAETSWNWGLK